MGADPKLARSRRSSIPLWLGILLGGLLVAAVVVGIVAVVSRPTPRAGSSVAATPDSSAAVASDLVGSPPALAKLHGQADRVLGGPSALVARIHSLRGYPIVLNVWGSWCAPCVAEFGLFRTASAAYGRGVAFLGADVGDSASDGQSFMAQHPVSYPSYQTSAPQLTAIVPQGLLGTPTTIFINRAGNVAYVHTGQYVSQGTLDSDIAHHAVRG